MRFGFSSSFSIPHLFTIAPMIPAGVQFWVFLAFFVGFAIKVPMFPFHTWLPDAHVEAPTGGSVVLAAIMPDEFAEYRNYDPEYRLGSEEHVFGVTHARVGNMLLRQGPDGWRDHAREAGVAEAEWAWGCVFCDLDNDGDQDLALSSAFATSGVGSWSENTGTAEPEWVHYDELYRNLPFIGVLKPEVYGGT